MSSSPYAGPIAALDRLLAECRETGDWSALCCPGCDAALEDTWMRVPERACECECPCGEPRVADLCTACGGDEFSNADAVLARAWRKRSEVKP